MFDIELTIISTDEGVMGMPTNEGVVSKTSKFIHGTGGGISDCWTDRVSPDWDL